MLTTLASCWNKGNFRCYEVKLKAGSHQELNPGMRPSQLSSWWDERFRVNCLWDPVPYQECTHSQHLIRAAQARGGIAKTELRLNYTKIIDFHITTEITRDSLGFYWEGSHFFNHLGSVIQKAKEASIMQYSNQVTIILLFNQPWLSYFLRTQVGG